MDIARLCSISILYVSDHTELAGPQCSKMWRATMIAKITQQSELQSCFAKNVSTCRILFSIQRRWCSQHQESRRMQPPTTTIVHACLRMAWLSLLIGNGECLLSLFSIFTYSYNAGVSWCTYYSQFSASTWLFFTSIIVLQSIEWSQEELLQAWCFVPAPTLLMTTRTIHHPKNSCEDWSCAIWQVHHPAQLTSIHWTCYPLCLLIEVIFHSCHSLLLNAFFNLIFMIKTIDEFFHPL